MINILSTKIKNISATIKGLIVKAYVQNTNDDSNYYPIVLISYLGKQNVDAEKINPYGLYTNPPIDLPALKFSVFGKDGNAVAIIYSQNTRFKNLKDGEVLIGNEKTRAYIKFSENGNIEIKTSSLIKITAPQIEVDGNLSLTVNGNVNVNAGTGTVTVNASQINLGSGGEKIARKGDPVQVNIGTGIGTITNGGTNTSI